MSKKIFKINIDKLLDADIDIDSTDLNIEKETDRLLLQINESLNHIQTTQKW